MRNIPIGARPDDLEIVVAYHELEGVVELARQNRKPPSKRYKWLVGFYVTSIVYYVSWGAYCTFVLHNSYWWLVFYGMLAACLMIFTRVILRSQKRDVVLNKKWSDIEAQALDLLAKVDPTHPNVTHVIDEQS